MRKKVMKLSSACLKKIFFTSSGTNEALYIAKSIAVYVDDSGEIPNLKDHYLLLKLSIFAFTS